MWTPFARISESRSVTTRQPLSSARTENIAHLRTTDRMHATDAASITPMASPVTATKMQMVYRTCFSCLGTTRQLPTIPGGPNHPNQVDPSR
jgi:hypothetical protein